MTTPSVLPPPFVAPMPTPAAVSPFCPPADYISQVSTPKINETLTSATPLALTHKDERGLEALEAILSGKGLGTSTPRYKDRL
ncbi:MAG: hypothetical protein IPJ69_06330 [Deltaproteobacteria bacterium]|nr:MAG: hypothetical protein IPJ69_06330 [Deltaproteobacteria bacterium]